jgi:hypothetical protein
MLNLFVFATPIANRPEGFQKGRKKTIHQQKRAQPPQPNPCCSRLPCSKCTREHEVWNELEPPRLFMMMQRMAVKAE